MCSMLQALLIRLDERWVQPSQNFRKVGIGNNSLWSPWEYIYGMIFLCFVGLGRWKFRVVYGVCCGAGDDHSLASDCRIQQSHKLTSRISACGRAGMSILHMIACKWLNVDGLVF